MISRLQNSMKEKDRGFTLIELLVVIIIIGILSAIAIPVFLNQRKKAIDASIKSDLRTVAAEVETFYTDNQAYPTTASIAASSGATDGTNKIVVTTGTNVTLSSGNVVTYKIGTAADSFCIQAANAKGTGGATKFYLYRSELGGLQAGIPTTTACA